MQADVSSELDPRDTGFSMCAKIGANTVMRDIVYGRTKELLWQMGTTLRYVEVDRIDGAHHPQALPSDPQHHAGNQPMSRNKYERHF